MTSGRLESRVRLTHRALSDLREIEQFSIKEWGRKTAGKYLDDIEAALDRVQENPDILRLEPDVAPGLSFYRVRRHFLVCDCQDDQIIVLTVIHTSMNVAARLLELEPRLATESKLLRARLHGSISKD